MTSRWTPAAILVAALIALVGCGGGGSLVGNEDVPAVIAFDASTGIDMPAARDVEDGPSDLTSEDVVIPDDTNSRCVDPDRDGFGFGLDCLGPDCDEGNPSVTDQCYCDRPGNQRTGCACRAGSLPEPCDLRTDRNTGPDGVCELGQRDCLNGRWSSCQRWRPSYPGAQIIQPVSACPGSCFPGCRHQVICPETGDVIPTGSSNVRIGNASHAVFCPTLSGGGTRAGGITGVCSGTATSNYVRGATAQPWIDACSQPGRNLFLAGVDDNVASETLPFLFNFYGTPYGTAGFSSNGLLGFPSTIATAANTSLPFASAPTPNAA